MLQVLLLVVQGDIRMKCNHCGNAVEFDIDCESVSSSSPVKENGCRDSLMFCNIKCYEVFHEENYVVREDEEGKKYFDFKRKANA